MNILESEDENSEDTRGSEFYGGQVSKILMMLVGLTFKGIYFRQAVQWLPSLVETCSETIAVRQ